MNGKYIGVIVGAVVAIMLVGSVLMPIIQESSTHTEMATPAGAFGPTVSYDGDITDLASSRITILNVKYKESTDNLEIYTMAHDGNLDYIYQGLRSGFPDKIILYADSNATMYIDGSTVHLTNSTDTYPLSYTTGLSIKFRDGGVRYGPNDAYVEGNFPTYYYSLDVAGDYTNIAGDNPPAMDTPAVAIDGMYIGLKGIETETQVPGHAIYVAIPLVILVSLLMAVAFVAFRRDY